MKIKSCLDYVIFTQGRRKIAAWVFSCTILVQLALPQSPRFSHFCIWDDHKSNKVYYYFSTKCFDFQPTQITKFPLPSFPLFSPSIPSPTLAALLWFVHEDTVLLCCSSLKKMLSLKFLCIFKTCSSPKKQFFTLTDKWDNVCLDGLWHRKHRVSGSALWRHTSNPGTPPLHRHRLFSRTLKNSTMFFVSRQSQTIFRFHNKATRKWAQEWW